MPITIHPFDTQFTTEIVNLHHASVHAIDPLIYSLEQQEAWAHTPPNYPYWVKRLALKKPFVAMVEAKIVGFIELEAKRTHRLCVHASNVSKMWRDAFALHICRKCGRAKRHKTVIPRSLYRRKTFF